MDRSGSSFQQVQSLSLVLKKAIKTKMIEEEVVAKSRNLQVTILQWQ